MRHSRDGADSRAAAVEDLFGTRYLEPLKQDPILTPLLARSRRRDNTLDKEPRYRRAKKLAFLTDPSPLQQHTRASTTIYYSSYCMYRFIVRASVCFHRLSPIASEDR